MSLSLGVGLSVVTGVNRSSLVTDRTPLTDGTLIAGILSLAGGVELVDVVGQPSISITDVPGLTPIGPPASGDALFFGFMPEQTDAPGFVFNPAQRVVIAANEASFALAGPPPPADQFQPLGQSLAFAIPERAALVSVQNDNVLDLDEIGAFPFSGLIADTDGDLWAIHATSSIKDDVDTSHTVALTGL